MFVSLSALSRRHLSYDDSLEDKQERYKNCSVLCFVQQFCTMICIHVMCAVLKVDCWFLGLVFMCLFSFGILCVLLV